MISHKLSIPDIEQSVSRPLIFATLDQIFDLCKLSKDTRINYAGQNGTLGTFGATLDKQSNEAIFANDRYTFVDVLETYQPGSQQETYARDDEEYEYPAIFADPAIGVYLRPIYLTSDVSISIRYQANSETEARRWYADMFLNISAGRDMNLHSFMLKYSIPRPFVTFIEEAWALREKNEPYGDSFQEYLVNNASPRLTIFANRAGEQRILGVSEKQCEIIGRFDFAGTPELPVRNTSTGQWDISFTYILSYQRPDAMRLQYPIVIHNELVDRKYLIDAVKEDNPLSRKTYASKSYRALEIFNSDYQSQQVRPEFPYYRLPYFDDFSIPYPLEGMATIFTALCLLEEDKKLLLNLNDLGEIAIDEDIMTFIKGEVPWLKDAYMSFFHVEVYKNDSLMPKESFTIDSNLNISFVEPQSMRYGYRVRLACCCAINMLHYPSIERLGNYPKAMVKLLSSMNDLLRLNPDFVNMGDLLHIEEWQLTYLYWVLTGRKQAPTSSYVWNDANISRAGNEKGNQGNRFVGSIDNTTLQNFYATRTNAIYTKSQVSIIARRIEDMA